MMLIVYLTLSKKDHIHGLLRGSNASEFADVWDASDHARTRLFICSNFVICVVAIVDCTPERRTFKRRRESAGTVGWGHEA